MTSTTSAAGSAERWGPLWGDRPVDWAATEEQQVPTYEEALRRVPIAGGGRVLDIACGTGMFLAPPGIARLVGPEREADVRAQIVAALAPHRSPHGAYRLHNEFHYLVATAP